MQVREKSGQTLVEPVDNDDLKTYLGYTQTDQDDIFDMLLTAVRKWVENYTGLSAIAKSYEVFFIPEDSFDGWFNLPFTPFDEITTVTLDTTVLTSDDAGLS